MSDFEEKLNAILSNPDAMAQVMNLAQSLGGNMAGPSQPSQKDESPHNDTPPSGMSPLGDLGRIGDLFSQIDPALIGKLLPLLGELNQSGGDERLQLLYALKPFLKPERQDKVERAVKAAKLIHIGKKFLTTIGGSHV